ncbi:Xaa-Pro dipeptidyl-peptidase [Solirubrobacter sp. CPCC 204708]|uniref:Xaa-Pro dipeptidyl-peptidase n=1 Tax=Solirubrobacter deserti TaxID=2282478 RepID=A0ABT4RLP9_9ACTN|nr:Xaa-Pro dipeptidyl-peptidase [Solirubrobacter deserti]MBE2316733.1 Xaa-Pro dipeptidyl-peptidase [Solirubrobacter deserti]MDA0139489.1 Xaa-Pro dipeptidyl-peptidase [Solirubrobacter deserti]
MQRGVRLAQASALTATLAMAAVVGTAAANPLPPKTALATGQAPEALAAAPAVPTFINGLAQPVFATAEADWINYELWVESNFDSDRDGKKDRIHVDVSRPKETETDGLKVPVIFEDSPYYAGGSDSPNFSVEHELGVPPAARIRAPDYFPSPTATSPRISTSWEPQFVPLGYAVVHAESPGSGHSDGCTTSGGRNETLGAVAVIDWLNGRAKGYTTRTGTVEAPANTWHNGKTAMTGVSYNGTLPIAAATTGVEGLAAIAPIAAISDWYDYYRSYGLVRAPHRDAGGQSGTNAYLGEDLDVLAEYTYSRLEDTRPNRSVCWPIIDEITATQDRVTGNRNATWDERNYMKDADKIKAATLLVHGGNDFNVMTKNAAQLWDVLKRNNVARQFYFHQGGHTRAIPYDMLNRWFTKYLWGHENGVDSVKSWVVREADACPPRNTTVAGAVSASDKVTVADASAYMVGNAVTIAGNAARTIKLINGNTLTLSGTVTATDGAAVSLACGNENPTAYADWPDPATQDATLKLKPGGATRGGLTFDPRPSAGAETLTDDASITAGALMNAASSPNRLIYQTAPLKSAIRISGTPKLSLNASFSKRANFSAALVSFPETGNGTIITRGWMDPENRNSEYTSEPTTPGTFYRLNFTMQAKDAVIPAGRRLALMVFSSDREYTIRPAAGTQVSLDLAGSTVTLPVVGGSGALASAIGEGVTSTPGDVTGTVPATLSLTLGTPAAFDPFIPGRQQEYTATTDATVTSTAGDATLTVSNLGHMTNGAFSLAEPLRAELAKSTWTGPTSGEKVGVTFKQLIKATDPLRTGTYSKTVTFTLSTTNP